MSDITAVRKEALRALISQWDTAVALSKALGHSNSSYITHLLAGRKPFTEKAARTIEKKLSLPHLWMDQQNGASPPITIDAKLLEEVVETVATASKGNIARNKLGVIVVEIYTHALANGSKIDIDQVERLVRLSR